MAGGTWDRDDVKIKGVDSGGVDREITAVQDGSDYRLKVDSSISNDEITTISFGHKKIHEGTHYTYTGNPVIANNAFFDIYFEVGSGSVVPHVKWVIASQTDAEIFFYEGATLTKGTALPFYNNNRTGVDASQNTGFGAVSSITSNGTLLYDHYIFSSNQTSGAGFSTSEYVLEQSTMYLWRLKSYANGNQTSIIMYGYETSEGIL